MREELSIAGLLAARKVLEKAAAELLSWSESCWGRWLETQRNAFDGQEQPSARLVAVAEVSCLDDLSLHVGLMQLISTSRLRCTVILSLPNDEAVRLAEGESRRKGWHGLVHLVRRSELELMLSGLSDDEPLALFPLPAVLGSDALACLSSLHGSPRHRPRQSYYLGTVAGLSRWLAAQTPIGQAQLAYALAELLRTQVGQLSVARTAVAAAYPNSEPTASPRILPPTDQGVEIQGSRANREVLISAVVEAQSRLAVFRRRADLLHRATSLRVRMPACFLTVSPQRIRVDMSGSDGSIARRELQFHVPPSRLEPWMMSAFLNRGGGGNPVIRAFAKGIGCRLAYAEDEPFELADLPVVWGVLRQSDRILSQAKAQGFYYFYIDHAYFERGHGRNYRISRNGYEAGPVRQCPPDRISKLGVELRPWRRSGRDIIVCPPTDYFMQAHGCPDWLETTLATLKRATDRPITIRAKPKEGEQTVPLPQALQSAHALITHSSNVAIEAACLGTPVFVDPASAAAPVGLTALSQIEAPVYPDREPWLAHLAYNQYSFEEIRTGKAWQMLLELEEREFA